MQKYAKAGVVLEKRKRDLQSIVIYLAAVAIFIVFTVAASLNGKSFLSLTNIQNIITQSSVISIIAIGQSIVILTGGIDLSVGSVVGIVGIGGGLLMKMGLPVWVVVILALLMGLVLGLINGSAISYGYIPAFITTLASMQIIRGLCMLLNSGKPVSGFPPALRAIMNSSILGIPIAIFYVAVFYLVMIIMMNQTRFGRYIYAIGGNSHAAALSGVNVKRIQLAAYMLSGLFASIGGVMLLSRLSYADPNAGGGYEMNAIAATVIGGIAMSGGRGKLGNTLVGALILGMLTTGLQILDVPNYFQTIITGFAIAGAVYIDKSKERKSADV